jgi:hypothetical protein
MVLQTLIFVSSVQSYASILYLWLPDNFRMTLRGIEIEHHNIVNDLMLKKQITYKPAKTNGFPKDTNVNIKYCLMFLVHPCKLIW